MDNHGNYWDGRTEDIIIFIHVYMYKLVPYISVLYAPATVGTR